MSTNKHYPPIEGLLGGCGENAATLAVAAVLEPSPNYPASARIIVGHTRSSECSDNGVGFSGDPAAIRRLARTLNQAADDVEAALGTLRTNEPVPALWFTASGSGPDPVFLELHAFKSDMDGAIPPSLGLRVRVTEDGVLFAGDLVDGGFHLVTSSVADLHRQIGAWLAKHGADAKE